MNPKRTRTSSYGRDHIAHLVASRSPARALGRRDRGMGWTIVAGIGGAGLIITLGPWPPTNGWFALFSGLSACPATAWILKKYAGIRFPGWARFTVAVLFIIAGRLTLKIEGRGTFLPDFSH